MKVFDHDFDQHNLKTFQEVYNKYKPGAYLVLIQLQDGYLKKVDDDIHYLGHSTDINMFKFSNDHKQFALFNYQKEKDDTTIKMFSLDDPVELFRKIKA